MKSRLYVNHHGSFVLFVPFVVEKIRYSPPAANCFRAAAASR
jgi:hypothetical protein